MIIHKLNPVDAVSLYNLDSTDFTWHDLSDFQDAILKTYLTDRDAGLCKVILKHVKVKHLPSEGKDLGGGPVDSKTFPGHWVRSLPILYVSYTDAEAEFMLKLKHGVVDFIMPSDVTVM